MNTKEMMAILVIISILIWLIFKFFRAGFWSKLDRRMNRYQNDRSMQQLQNEKKKAEAYFRDVMAQHFDSASEETHPAFEVIFDGLRMMILSAPTSLLGRKQNHVMYTYRYNGNMIFCVHSGREFDKTAFEKELNHILVRHSVVPRN